MNCRLSVALFPTIVLTVACSHAVTPPDDIGSECTSDGQCRHRMCMSTGSIAICTRPCSDEAGCPLGWDCVTGACACTHTIERCDREDNDCDAVVDEGAVCTFDECEEDVASASVPAVGCTELGSLPAGPPASCFVEGGAELRGMSARLYNPELMTWHFTVRDLGSGEVYVAWSTNSPVECSHYCENAFLVADAAEEFVLPPRTAVRLYIAEGSAPYSIELCAGE